MACGARRESPSPIALPDSRGIGSAAAIAFILASLGSGFVLGGHYDRMIATQGSLQDMLARGFGFGVRHIVLSGHSELTQDEVISLSGLQAHQSLPFLDPKSLQTRLQSVR